MSTILVVDDEIGIRELLSEILADEGHAVLTAENAAAARALRQSETPDLVLLDIWMPDTDGVTLLKEWAASGQLTMPVIMMSGHATIDTAVEATRFGALDFLEKPIALARLLAAVRSGLERGKARQGLLAAGAATLAATTAGREREARLAAVEPPREVAPPPPLPPANAASVALDQPLREARDHFERVYFEYHLARESYSMTRVADRAGLERTHLYRKLKQLGIELQRGSRRAPAAEDAGAGDAQPAPAGGGDTPAQ
jgi:DNA-binding NtrC family response regulator